MRAYVDVYDSRCMRCRTLWQDVDHVVVFGLVVYRGPLPVGMSYHTHHPVVHVYVASRSAEQLDCMQADGQEHVWVPVAPVAALLPSGVPWLLLVCCPRLPN